jgi:hypothetical protein
MTDDALLAQLIGWLWREGGLAAAEELVMPAHPARAWVQGELSSPAQFGDMVRILANGGHLPLLAALVLRTRAESAAPLPPEAERALAGALARWDDEAHRSLAARPEAPDLFLCYAHEDAERVGWIAQALREAGLAVFRDTDNIAPGSSIAGSVATASPPAARRSWSSPRRAPSHSGSPARSRCSCPAGAWRGGRSIPS